MKKHIIIAGMTVLFTASGIAGAQDAANQKENVKHGQSLTDYLYDETSPVIIQQYKQMVAEFITVHKQMVKENPGMRGLSVTAGLSPQITYQHREMLQQLAYMHELITITGNDTETCFDQFIRKDLTEMQKINKISTKDISGGLVI